MKVTEYLDIARKTDQLDPTRPINANYKIMPILGLAGEIGSLLTELKKMVREPERVARVSRLRLEEELGDIIWYAATISRRSGIDFQRDVLFANLERVANKPDLYLPLIDPNHRPGKVLRDAVEKKGIKIADTFQSYRRYAAKSARFKKNEEAVIPYLYSIWKNSGELLEDGRLDLSQGAFNSEEAKIVAQVLGDVMWYVAGFSTLYDLSLDVVAERNAKKTLSMYMPDQERVPTPLYDKDFRALEQFPRRFDVDFVPADDDTAVMLINGVRVGDPLRDNAHQLEEGEEGEIDGYRFHDSIHLAFVAVLGWSPVMRALLMRKRKSKRRIDDVEDGARAGIVEEMIVKLAHSYAVGIDKEKLLDGKVRVGFDLLKQIRILAEGLEVAGGREGVKACEYWEWDKAIQEGFKIYNQLRQHRRGRIRVDIEARSVAFSKLKQGEGEHLPICS